MLGPSRVRGRVLAFAFVLTVVTYLDRVCISAAAPYIMKELNLSVLQMSAVFSAFILAYSMFEVPSGWLGDVRGPRRVLVLLSFVFLVSFVVHEQQSAIRPSS